MPAQGKLFSWEEMSGQSSREVSARLSALALEGLSKRFGAIRAVDSVSMQVETGEVLGLLGPNGCGKTTLLNLITGLIRPDRGVVRVLEKRVDKMTVHDRVRAGVVRLFQEPRVFESLAAELKTSTLRRLGPGLLAYITARM